jgi:hypothetical protein
VLHAVGQRFGKERAGVENGNAADTRRRRRLAGIWEIKDVHTGERISKFRARKRADVDRMLQMASVGLKRPLADFEAVYLTDWE